MPVALLPVPMIRAFLPVHAAPRMRMATAVFNAPLRASEPAYWTSSPSTFCRATHAHGDDDAGIAETWREPDHEAEALDAGDFRRHDIAPGFRAVFGIDACGHSLAEF